PIGSTFEIISVPSESTTFCAVRSAYPPFSSSMTGSSSGIIPSSASRPAGHQPPHSTVSFSAASSAPRSTPVCPPEMIFSNSSEHLSFLVIVNSLTTSLTGAKHRLCYSVPRHHMLKLAPAPFTKAAFLVALTVLFYLPALRNGFIWDYDSWLMHNRTLEGVTG